MKRLRVRPAGSPRNAASADTTRCTSRLDPGELGIGCLAGDTTAGRDQPRSRNRSPGPLYLQTANRISFDQRMPLGAIWKRTTFAPSSAPDLPAGAVLDPDRGQITLLAPLPVGIRASVTRPALGYLLTFSGISFDAAQPVTAPERGPGGLAGSGRVIAYRSVSIARVPGGNDRSETQIVEQPGTLALATTNLSISWNMTSGETAPVSSSDPFSPREANLAAQYPGLAEEGLILGLTVQFSSAHRSTQSRQAFLGGSTQTVRPATPKHSYPRSPSTAAPEVAAADEAAPPPPNPGASSGFLTG